LWRTVALEVEGAIVLDDLNQAEVGRAAAHVAHEDGLAHVDGVAPVVLLGGDPRVERGLGLFQ
jgi:hypothetical protein